jgi:hypothetical protein
LHRRDDGGGVFQDEGADDDGEGLEQERMIGQCQQRDDRTGQHVERRLPFRSFSTMAGDWEAIRQSLITCAPFWNSNISPDRWTRVDSAGYWWVSSPGRTVREETTE